MLTLFVSLALQLWLLEEQSAKSEQALLDEALPLRMMVVFDPYTGELVEFRANEGTQARYEEYLSLQNPKAFALSPSQVWSYNDTKEKALEECRSYLRAGEFSCFIADVNGEIVAEEPVWLTIHEAP